MLSPRNASALSNFTTICSGVCIENSLMVIHSAPPQAARTTQNNPLKTNGPKTPSPPLEVRRSNHFQHDPAITAIEETLVVASDNRVKDSNHNQKLSAGKTQDIHPLEENVSTSRSASSVDILELVGARKPLTARTLNLPATNEQNPVSHTQY